MKKKIKNLMYEFMVNNSEPLKSGNLQRQIHPDHVVINPTKKVPLLPNNRWIDNEDKSIYKRFDFKDTIKRNTFLMRLFEYEEKTNHHGKILIDENFVEITLVTKNINMATEIDKEYAKYADSVYKDVILEWRKGERFKFIPC
jgi:pterin-4a-carbinolamine dehydratase